MLTRAAVLLVALAPSCLAVAPGGPVDASGSPPVSPAVQTPCDAARAAVARVCGRPVDVCPLRPECAAAAGDVGALALCGVRCP